MKRIGTIREISNKEIESYRQRKGFLIELRELDKKCSELYSRGKYLPVATKEEIKESREKLKKSGQLIIDFYQKTFISKYSKFSDYFFTESGKILKQTANLASDFIKSKNDFGLTILLIPNDFIKNSSNQLEALIEKLSRQI